jgi:FHA domain
MSNELSLATINGGKEFLLATLSSDLLVVGRDSDAEISIQDEGISRNHGQFIRAGARWLYRDLDSTNGSFLNANKLKPSELYLLRSGDVIQLADISLIIRYEVVSPKFLNANSVLIIRGDGLVDEFVLPQLDLLVEYAKESDIEVYGVNFTLTDDSQINWHFGEVFKDYDSKQKTGVLFSISLTPEALGFRVVAPNEKIKLNGLQLSTKEVTSKLALNDRDCLAYKDYRFIVNAADLVEQRESEAKQSFKNQYIRDKESGSVDDKLPTPLYNKLNEQEVIPRASSSTSLINVATSKDKVLLGKLIDQSVIGQFGKITPMGEDDSTKVIERSSVSKSLGRNSGQRSFGTKSQSRSSIISKYGGEGWSTEIVEIIQVLFGVFLIFAIITTLIWLGSTITN